MVFSAEFMRLFLGAKGARFMGNLVEIILPDFGGGTAETLEAIVSWWPVEVGDGLNTGDDLLEIATDKANFVVPCPCAGVLMEKRVNEEDRVRVGDVVAVLKTQES